LTEYCSFPDRPLTQRLYYTDAKLLEFDAQVLDITEGGRAVYLDRTAFYPTSGGQQHDTGTLSGARVVDVIDEDARIKHVLDAPLTVTATVRGSIDAARRIDHMQQHTGQHLLSAVFAEQFGFPTVSVHFGPDYSTVDFDVEAISREQLLRAQSVANEIVMDARPVTVSFEDASNATGLRRPTDREGPIRVITIEGVDRSACGGTHVSSTAAIGAVLLRSTERMKKTTRVEFVCGPRAIACARADYDRLAVIAASFSASISDLPVLIAAQKASLHDAEQQLRRFEREVAAHRAQDLVARTEALPSGRKVIVLESAPSMTALRTLAQAITAHPGTVVIGTVIEPPSVLFATSEDTGIDAGKTLRAALEPLGGKGGGSPRAAQGSIPPAGVTADAIASLRSAVG
jgi:alanyl-tRNA synthetase